MLPQSQSLSERIESVEYLLRRAEQESIAAIRAGDKSIAERHDEMAHAYSLRAAALLGGRAG
jgi:hypothetical protein